MDKHDQQAMRADEATRILNSDLFGQAFDDVREAYLRGWEALPTADTESARDIHRRLKCLADVKHALQVHINTGKLAKAEMSKREKFAKATRNFLSAA